MKDHPVFHLGMKNRRIAHGLKVTGFVFLAIVLITVFIVAGLILGSAAGPVIEILTMSGMVFPALMIVARLHKKWGFGEFEIYPRLRALSFIATPCRSSFRPRVNQQVMRT